MTIQQSAQKYRYYVDADGVPAYDSELENAYDEMLDDCYPEISVCGLSYCASNVLYCTDRVAYDLGLGEYIDSLGYEERLLSIEEAAKLRGEE